MQYRRVVLKDRVQIYTLLLKGLTKEEIAKEMGFHKSTIGRELQRHTFENSPYDPIVADQRSIESFKRCRKKHKLQDDLLQIVIKKLRSGWSPEQTSGRLKLEKSSYTVSHQTIYRYIKTHNQYAKYLRLSYKRRGFGRMKIQKQCRESSWKTPLSARSNEANNRRAIGHWERDTFFCSQRKSNVLVLTDRKSRYTLLRKSTTLRSDVMARLTNRTLKQAKAPVKSITNDNGSEFFDLTPIKVPVYFCEARKPQQRGTIENTIGLIRQYLKRKDPLEEVSHQKVTALQRKLNLRPRKILDYQTPYEVFHATRVALAM